MFVLRYLARCLRPPQVKRGSRSGRRTGSLRGDPGHGPENRCCFHVSLSCLEGMAQRLPAITLRKRCPIAPFVVPPPPRHLWVRFEKMGFVVQGIQTFGKAGR